MTGLVFPSRMKPNEKVKRVLIYIALSFLIFGCFAYIMDQLTTILITPIPIKKMNKQQLQVFYERRKLEQLKLQRQILGPTTGIIGKDEKQDEKLENWR